MSFGYLLALFVSLGGLSVIDYRYKLAFFYDRRRTLYTLAFCTVFFLLWDVAGIGLHIFYTGTSRFLTGWQLMKDLPIEEPVFLILLNYCTLIVWRLLKK